MQTTERVESVEFSRAAPPAARRDTGARLRAFVGRFAAGIAAAMIAGVCLLEVLLGSMPTRIYSVDLFIFLDGAWRVDSGQVAHQDFFAGFSVLLWKPLQLAFGLTGFDLEGLGIARALFTAAVGAWTFLLVRKRLSPTLGLVVTFVVVALVAAARPLGVGASMFSHAMFYNRVGYALVFIVVLESLYLARFWLPAGRDRLWGGVSTGMALACLALLKVSFLVPAVLLLGVGAVLWGTSRRHLAGLVLGGLGVLVVAVALLGFKPGPWLSEMVELGRSREESMFGALRDVVRAELLPLALLSIAGFGLALAASLERALAVRFVLATLAVAGADVYCRATNAQAGDLPLTALWCVLGVLLLAGPAAARRSTYAPPRLLGPALSVVLLLALTTPLIGKDVVSLAGAAYVSATEPDDVPRIEADRLSAWTTEAWRGDPKFLASNGPRLVAVTNDGLQLLRRASRPDESVGSVTSVNRFSSALGRPPATGGAPWIHVGNNFSAANPPAPEKLFGTPDLLMVQRYDSVDGSAPLLEIYPELLKGFQQAGESRYWTLYRRAS